MSLFAVNDHVKASIVINTVGVQTITKLFFAVAARLGADSDQKVADDWATAFWANVAPLVSSSTTLELIKFQNVVDGTKAIAFPEAAGTGGPNPHPSHQTLRFTSYGSTTEYLSDPVNVVLKQTRNQMCLAGVDELHSTDGRLNTSAPFANILGFLKNQTTTDAAGIIAQPIVENVVNPGNKIYHQVLFGRVTTRFRTLQSRRSRLPV